MSEEGTPTQLVVKKVCIKDGMHKQHKHFQVGAKKLTENF